MARHHPEFDPQDSDFEQFAREIVELDPNVEKLRGASNHAGDDGLYRDRLTGDLITVEAKFYRQQKSLPKKDIDNLNEAAARNSEAFGKSSQEYLFTTAGSVAQGGKKKLRQIARSGNPVVVVNFDRLEKITNDTLTPEHLAVGLKACLTKKARRTTE